MNVPPGAWRIAIVVRELPIPVYAGLNLIIHHLARRLAARHAVHVFVLDPNHDGDTSSFGVPFTCFAPPSGPMPAGTGVSRLARYYRVTPQKLTWLSDALAAYKPDVMLGFGYDLGPYFGLIRNDVPKILDVVDSEILYLWRQIIRGDISLINVKHLIASLGLALAYLKRCDRLITVSDEDTANVRRFAGNRRTSTIANGVDCDYFVRDPAIQSVPGRIIFTGSLNWPPNQLAIVWFLDRCWEHIRRARPDASVVIIGKLLEEQLKRRLERHGNVQVIGFVPDIRTYVQSAQVSIAPMISGSGIKNKVLEAWAMEQAVVATPLATRGLRCTPDVDILIAKEPAAFANAVIRVLEDDTLRLRLGKYGRANVVADYSWDGVVDRLETVLRAASRPTTV